MEIISIFVMHDKAFIMQDNFTKSFQKPIFLDHDGSIDDYVALITLLTLDKYRLTGISVCQGVGDEETSFELTLGILDFFCRYDVEVARGCYEALNSLLETRNEKSTSVKQIDGLATKKVNGFKISKEDPADFMARKIMEQEEKSIVVLACSAMNFSNMLKRYPAITEKIDKVLWVAGAFLADGNVVAPDHDGSAEWNIFLNPAAASDLLAAEIPVILFPLDAGSLLPVDNYFMYHLGKNAQKRLSKLVYQLIEPDYNQKKPLYLNSILPAVYLAIPGIFELESKSIKIEQRGTSMGNIYKTSLGQRIKHVIRIDEEEYYEFLIEQFKQF